MPKVRDYIWFLEPLDSDTNAVFGRELPEEDGQDVLCADNKRHKLWSCQYDFMQKCRRSMKKLKLKFTVWKQLPEKSAVLFHSTVNYKARNAKKKVT